MTVPSTSPPWPQISSRERLSSATWDIESTIFPARCGRARGAAAAMEIRARSGCSKDREQSAKEEKLPRVRGCEIGQMLTREAGESWSRGRSGQRPRRTVGEDPDDDGGVSRERGKPQKC